MIAKRELRKADKGPSQAAVPPRLESSKNSPSSIQRDQVWYREREPFILLDSVDRARYVMKPSIPWSDIPVDYTMSATRTAKVDESAML